MYDRSLAGPWTLDNISASVTASYRDSLCFQYHRQVNHLSINSHCGASACLRRGKDSQSPCLLLIGICITTMNGGDLVRMNAKHCAESKPFPPSSVCLNKIRIADPCCDAIDRRLDPRQPGRQHDL